MNLKTRNKNITNNKKYLNHKLMILCKCMKN